MSDYSDEDFEMSGNGTVGTFNAKPPTKPSALSKASAPAKAAPFKAASNVNDFMLADDDDDDGYAPGGQGTASNEDEYEEDDFDEEEEEQFKKTAVEFAQKLTALRQSTQYEMVEGGEEPTGIKSNKGGRQQEETKGRVAPGRSVGRPNQQAAAMSPPQNSQKANVVRQARHANQEITEDSLKSPTMLKTTMDKEGQKKSSKLRMNQNQSPSQQDAASMYGGAGGAGGAGERTNPFRFIEAALNEAKSKIEKMKNTPQILESLPDDEKKKKFLKAENKLLRENLKRMSDNVNVLIEKMNQESLKKRNPVRGGGRAGGATSNAGGGMSHQGDEIGNVTIDEEGRPVKGGVGAGLVPGHLPQSMKGGPQSVAGQSVAGQSRRNISPSGRGAGSVHRGGVSVAERELQNTDKAIVNLMKEHNKLKRRLEMIQQPDFLLNLKRDLKTTQEEIKQQEKLKRQLKVDQLRREKKLDNLIEQSEPDVLKQVQDTTQRLAYLTEKLAKLEEENKKAEELRNQQIDQLEELRNRLAKLNTIAEHYGVSVEKSKENMAEHKKLTEQLEHLNKQKRILTQAIDTQTRKQEALTAEKKRDLEQLQMRKGEILAKYNERVIELREKGLQIRDLIERAKTEADDGLQDILSKWQEANERILEKYPEGSQMSFAQLEEAARNSIEDQQEMNDVSQAAQKNIRDKKGSINRANAGKKGAAQKQAVVPHRDDEMQVYLSEIRQNQEHLIHQLRKDSQAAQALVEQPVEESVYEAPEESKNGDSVVSVSAASLKNTRKLVGNNQSQAPVAEANNDAANELAALRAELEKEKAEKAQLAKEVAAQQQAATQKEEAQAQAEHQRVQEQLRKKREEEEKAASQQVEGGEQVTLPVKPIVAAESQGRLSGLGSVAGDSKPALGSRPKMGGAFGKPSLGVRNSYTKSSVEREGPTITQAPPTDNGRNSRYEATQQSVESIPVAEAQPVQEEPKKEEVAESKPMSFLERRALNKGGPQASYQPSMVSNSNILRPQQEEIKIIQPVRDSMAYNPTARQSTIGNDIIRPNNNANVGASMKSYQPSTVGQVPQTLNPTMQTEENAPAPRRRRGGDSPKNTEQESAPDRKVALDPFAGVGFDLKKPSAVNVGASQANKPLTYEQKLAKEASQGSFLDMIGSGSKAPQAAPSTNSRPMMMQASVSRAAPSQVNQSVAASAVNASQMSKPKTNLIANLDDLEDLDL